MQSPHAQDRLPVQHAPQLYTTLCHLARQQRLIFFAGLPGTGKSLLSHQLAHIAQAQQRVVHMLQWDVARPGFEASAAGRRYPVVQGVTHAVIRKAAGLWARQALVLWQQCYPEPHHLLIGETPLVGQRFMELVSPTADAAEALLQTACFVLPVPSRQVRLRLEAERQRRSLQPLHPQEREDAPPEVLQALWRQLPVVAAALDLAVSSPEADPPYDPLLYQRVYEHLLRYRQTRVLAIETQLLTDTFSVYDYAIVRHDLRPTEEDARRYIQAVEQRYPDVRVLQREIEQWYVL